MKHRVSLMGAFACAVCLALALVGCSQTPEYTPETLEPSVSSPTIGKDGVLRVGVGGGAPFVSSTDGSASGLDVDVAAAVAGQLGLKLEVVVLGEGGKEVDIDSALKKGDVDVVMGATSSDKGSSIWVSEPYTQTGVALFAAPGTKAPTSASSPKIAAQSSSTSAWAVTNAFGDEALVSKADLLSALSSIEGGNGVQYVAADAVIGTYAALGQNVDVEPVAVLGSVGGYGIAVATGNAELQKAISEALSAVSGNGVVSAICAKWLGSSLDLSALPSIEVSAAASPGAEKASDDGEQADGETSSSDDAAADDGVAPKEEAGSNAVLPDGTIAGQAGNAAASADAQGSASSTASGQTNPSANGGAQAA